jgi:hypothetical protein
VRRCAWCGRVADRRGRYRPVAIIAASAVVTDGMCPRCAARGLAQVRQRQRQVRALHRPALAA